MGAQPAKLRQRTRRARAFNGRDKELRTICARACVGHGKKAGRVVLDLEILVGEIAAVNRAACHHDRSRTASLCVYERPLLARRPFAAKSPRPASTSRSSQCLYSCSVPSRIPPVPLWLVKSPPCSMKLGMILWKIHPVDGASVRPAGGAPTDKPTQRRSRGPTKARCMFSSSKISIVRQEIIPPECSGPVPQRADTERRTFVAG